MEPQQQRQTAYKIWISDLINGTFQKQAGEWEPNYIQIKDLKVSRVNILATVVNAYKSEDGNYSTLTLDDGSGQIQIKAWREDVARVGNITIGNTVTVIGRVREYNNEKYLLPEIIKLLDNPSWIKVRKLELTQLYGQPSQQVTETPVTHSREITEHPVPVSENSRQKILNLIEKNSTEEGADITSVILASGVSEEEAESIINELISEGEAYQPKPGKVKIIS